MIDPKPVILERDGIRLEALSPEHDNGLVAAATDGELWKLWFTSVPEPGAAMTYIRDALRGQSDGHMLPWAVRDLATNAIVGSTRYHDIVAAIDRFAIAERARLTADYKIDGTPAMAVHGRYTVGAHDTMMDTVNQLVAAVRKNK